MASLACPECSTINCWYRCQKCGEVYCKSCNMGGCPVCRSSDRKPANLDENQKKQMQRRFDSR